MPFGDSGSRDAQVQADRTRSPEGRRVVIVVPMIRIDRVDRVPNTSEAGFDGRRRGYSPRSEKRSAHRDRAGVLVREFTE